MGLNDTELTGKLVALLYRDCLIDCNSEESVISKPPGQLVLIITNMTGTSGQNKQDLLSGMMNACKISSGNYRVIGLTSGIFSEWVELEDKFQPKAILVFGSEGEIKAAGIDTDHYSTIEKNGIPLLVAPSLDEIASDKKTKMAVWEKLKSFFSI